MQISLNRKYDLIPAMLVMGAIAVSETVDAAPTVSGNTIAWTDDGWHQVQDQTSYESLCQGTRQCSVPEGVYIVINHTTGERFENIPVTTTSAHPEAGVDPDPDSGATPTISPAPVAATGQTISYGFGDDGDYQSGASVQGVRYQDNGDGTFTDTLTGIIWLGIRDCFVERDWFGSLEHANTLSANSDLCPALNDGSEAGDWRLPNVKELFSLVDISADTALFGNRIPFSGTFNVIPFNSYWSSSSFKPVPETTGWAVEPNFGRPTVTQKDVIGIVWPIRVSD